HSLLGFNLGVEIGQLAIVCALFPILYLVRRQWVYPKVILRYGAALLIVVSMYWFIERGFAVDLPAGAVFNAVRDRVIETVT
ncbi:MAG TPA: HupE/UreJ family protein, partial [Gammaproteobacteria bacterium]|nr:HupE/UreJ family protein [Gammaproteobacteria bacterium]